ncbi:hypothetical protein FB451DRAFT_1391862 [Mycena latifolia]|nr:hypothetical protein FB451DRAFT_1391862 [Mycena latifolia]
MLSIRSLVVVAVAYLMASTQVSAAGGCASLRPPERERCEAYERAYAPRPKP